MLHRVAFSFRFLYNTSNFNDRLKSFIILGEQVLLADSKKWGTAMKRCSFCWGVRHLFVHIPRETNWTFSSVYTWGNVTRLLCVSKHQWKNHNITLLSLCITSDRRRNHSTNRTWNITEILFFSFQSVHYYAIWIQERMLRVLWRRHEIVFFSSQTNLPRPRGAIKNSMQ